MAANSDNNTKKNTSSDLRAAALKYDNQTEAAPKVVAKGRALVAEKILEIAKDYGIPVHRDADLVHILEQIELDQEIPLEVYSVVAEIFAYIYRINKNKRSPSHDG